MLSRDFRSFQTFFLLLVFVLSARSSPVVSKQETSQCSARDIAIVRRTVLGESYFCKWWLSDARTRSPFLEFTPAQVDKLCKCIVNASSKSKREDTFIHESILEKRQTKAACSAEVSIQFTQPWRFCKFYNAYPRTTSPFAKYSARQLVALCDCANDQTTSSTKKSSSSIRKPTSSSKTSSTSKGLSTTKTSSTQRPTSIKKSSSTQKTTSSLVKPSSQTSSRSSSKTSSGFSSKTSSMSKSTSSSVKQVISSSSKSSSTSKISTTTSKPVSKTSALNTIVSIPDSLSLKPSSTSLSTLSKSVSSSASSVSKSLSSSKVVSSSIQTTSSAKASTSSSVPFCLAQSTLLASIPGQIDQASEYCSSLLRPVVTAVATTTEVVSTTLPTIRSTAIVILDSSVAETATSTYVETETVVVSVTAESTATHTSEISDYVETTNIGTLLLVTITEYQTSTVLAARDVGPSSIPEPEAWSKLSPSQMTQACDCILQKAALKPTTVYRSTEVQTRTTTIMTDIVATSTQINAVTSFVTRIHTTILPLNLTSTVSTAVSDYTVIKTLNATSTTSLDSLGTTTQYTTALTTYSSIHVLAPTAPGVPAIALAQPTAIVGDVNGAPYDVDDNSYAVVLPVDITLFGESGVNVQLSVNGFINLGSVTAYGFYEDLYIYKGTQQGIYYEVSGSAPHRQTVFEFYVSSYGDSTQYYHFLMKFAEDKPNIVTYQYLSVSDKGQYAAVGVRSTNLNQATMLSSPQGMICPGLQLTFDTTPGQSSYNIDSPGSCT
ncbi:unnamed protein product [Aureobasidium uvarum]|uniref:Uncharacterized protein n=1 Tax=Aureobasidium uvarum TaxID=2773716 RepID=A0A9N8PQU9_9PEZI|nr:unnamed protein product [Aureobasidium uvarum]